MTGHEKNDLPERTPRMPSPNAALGAAVILAIALCLAGRAPPPEEKKEPGKPGGTILIGEEGARMASPSVSPFRKSHAPPSRMPIVPRPIFHPFLFHR